MARLLPPPRLPPPGVGGVCAGVWAPWSGTSPFPRPLEAPPEAAPATPPAPPTTKPRSPLNGLQPRAPGSGFVWVLLEVPPLAKAFPPKLLSVHLGTWNSHGGSFSIPRGGRWPGRLSPMEPQIHRGSGSPACPMASTPRARGPEGLWMRQARRHQVLQENTQPALGRGHGDLRGN